LEEQLKDVSKNHSDSLEELKKESEQRISSDKKCELLEE